jgi:hypothetical protein
MQIRIRGGSGFVVIEACTILEAIFKKNNTKFDTKKNIYLGSFSGLGWDLCKLGALKLNLH